MKKLALVVLGLIIAFGVAQAKSLSSLEEKVARNPDNAKAVYDLTYAYCKADSVLKAVEAWKKLAELDLELASETYIVTNVASYVGVEPFFPEPIIDSMGFGPRFSADEEYVTFSTNKAGNFVVARIKFTGEDFQLITNHTTTDIFPCFAGSNNKYLYSSSSDDKSDNGIAIYDAETGEKEWVFNGLFEMFESPDWGGDGKPIVFTYGSPDTKSAEIGFYDYVNGEFIELTNTIYTERQSRLSQDKKLIVYVSNQDLQADVYIMDRSGKFKEKVSPWQGNDGSPDFGDGDKKVAFVSDRNGGGQFDVFIYDRRTELTIPVTVDEGHDDMPDLSSDGNWLIFQSNRGDGQPRIYAVSLNQPISAERLLEELSELGY